MYMVKNDEDPYWPEDLKTKKRAGQVDSVRGESSSCMDSAITVTVTGNTVSAGKKKEADEDDPTGSGSLDVGKYQTKQRDQLDSKKEEIITQVQKHPDIKLEARTSETNSVKHLKLKTNPDCSSEKQAQGQVRDQGGVVQQVAQGDGQGGSKTMGGNITRLGTRQRAWKGAGRNLKTKK